MTVRVIEGDCRQALGTFDAGSVQTCVTSPPYFGLRNYGVEGQIGLEATVEDYVAQLVAVFRAVRRVLRDDGTLWLNLGDSYASNGVRGDTRGGFNQRWYGSGAPAKNEQTHLHVPAQRVPSGLKTKDLIGIPWRVAFALQADGWYLRSDIIWSKPNPMPESVRDRPTKAHEYLFLLTKQPRYYFDAEAVKEDAIDVRSIGRRTSANGQGSGELANGDRFGGGESGRNIRSVWTIATAPFSEAHFATFPPALVEPCIKAGSREGDTVLDPFGGAGTTGLVADRLGRDAVLVELNPGYAEMARRRIVGDAPLLARVV